MNYASIIDSGLISLAAGTVFLAAETLIRSRKLSAASAISRLSGLAIIGKVSPFIGLFGTILHLMAALSTLTLGSDIATIGGPISLALKSTLLGLAAAIPALIAHDLLLTRFSLLGTFDREAS